MGQSQLFYLTTANTPISITPQGFLARSFIVFNPNAFWVNFPSLQAAINPFSNGIVAPVPPTGSILASTVTPPGLAADTLVGQTALIIASEDVLSPGIWPVPAPSRPTPLWQGLSRLGNWTSAGAQPLNFAIAPPLTGIAILVYRTSGLGDFALHAKGNTSNLDYLAMPGISASQTQVATALITAPVTPSTPGDSSLNFTWTDTGGFSYVLFQLASAVTTTLAAAGQPPWASAQSITQNAGAATLVAAVGGQSVYMFGGNIAIDTAVAGSEVQIQDSGGNVLAVFSAGAVGNAPFQFNGVPVGGVASGLGVKTFLAGGAPVVRTTLAYTQA